MSGYHRVTFQGKGRLFVNTRRWIRAVFPITSALCLHSYAWERNIEGMAFYHLNECTHSKTMRGCSVVIFVIYFLKYSCSRFYGPIHTDIFECNPNLEYQPTIKHKYLYCYTFLSRVSNEKKKSRIWTLVLQYISSELFSDHVSKVCHKQSKAVLLFVTIFWWFLLLLLLFTG